MNGISTAMIDFPSNGENAQRTPGYLARPASGGDAPALVVIQEWWGLVPHIKEVAERFARQGYLALAPDLYHGKTAGEPDEARKLLMELDRLRAVQEISAAADYLHSLTSGRVGVVGWCMGGSLVMATAASPARIDAAVAFYGVPRDLETLSQVHCPLLGLFGELDQSIPAASIQRLGEILEEAGVTHEIHVYPGAPHAFFNDSRPHIYKEDAAQDAWRRTLDWFGKYLA